MAFTYHHPVGILYIGDGGSSGSGLYTATSWVTGLLSLLPRGGWVTIPLVPAWSVQQDNSSPKARRALTATAINLAEVLAAGMGKSVCSPRGCEIQIPKIESAALLGTKPAKINLKT